MSVEIGTRVLYHGRVHVVRAHNDPAAHPDRRVREVAAESYPDGIGYELWPEGVPCKFGFRHLATYFVRRTSFTVVGEESHD